MAAPRDDAGRENLKYQFDDHLGAGLHKKPCRACVDLDSWMRMYGSKKKKSKPGSELAGSENQASTNNSLTAIDHPECPLDKDELGRRTWSFLHTMAAYYPDSPTEKQQKDMKDMMHIFSRFYPCDFCAKDFRKSIKNNEPDTSSQNSFSQWMCQMHNEVNRKLGKPEFDCSRINERWRDGWKDGSCD